MERPTSRFENIKIVLIAVAISVAISAALVGVFILIF
jgi:hypothetical protein